MTHAACLDNGSHWISQRMATNIIRRDTSLRLAQLERTSAVQAKQVATPRPPKLSAIPAGTSGGRFIDVRGEP